MLVEMMLQQIVRSLNIQSLDDALAFARKQGVNAKPVSQDELERVLLDLATAAVSPGKAAIRAEFDGEQGKMVAFLVLPDKISVK